MSKPDSHVKAIKTQNAVEDLMQPGGGTAVIDFWAPWCRPCLAMAPHFEKVAETYKEEPVAFYKVDTEAYPRLGQAFNVRALPTMAFIHEGEILDVSVGAMAAPALSRKVDWLLSKARGEGFVTRLLGRHRKR